MEVLSDFTAFSLLFDKSNPLIFEMCVIRRTIAYLCYLLTFGVFTSAISSIRTILNLFECLFFIFFYTCRYRGERGKLS